MSRTTTDEAPPPSSAPRHPGWIVSNWLGWICAAVLALGLGILTQWMLSLRADLLRSRETEAMALVEAEDALQRLEAERLFSQGQLNQLRALKEDAASLQRVADLHRLEFAVLDPADGASDVGGWVVWSPEAGEGLLVVDRVPEPPAERRLQLWMTEGSRGERVSAGDFVVEPGVGRAQFVFKPERDVVEAAGFVLKQVPPALESGAGI